MGVLIPVTRLDNWLAAQWQAWLGTNPGCCSPAEIAALVYAYLVRFLAVALQTVGASLAKITPAMDDASRSLGGRAGRPCAGSMPILRGSLFTAGLLVFVDVMKELPATLVMRPFSFDTLATQAYTLASDRRLAGRPCRARHVGVGLLPLIALSRFRQIPPPVVEMKSPLARGWKPPTLLAARGGLFESGPVEDHLRFGLIHGEILHRQLVGLEWAQGVGQGWRP